MNATALVAVLEAAEPYLFALFSVCLAAFLVDFTLGLFRKA